MEPIIHPASIHYEGKLAPRLPPLINNPRRLTRVCFLPLFFFSCGGGGGGGGLFLIP